MNFKITSIVLFCMSSISVIAQPQKFTPENLWELKYVNGGNVSADNSQVLYQTTTYDMKNNKGESNYFAYDLNNKSHKQIKPTFGKVENIRWHKNQLVGIITKDEIKSIVKFSIDDASPKIFLEKPKDVLQDFKFSDDGKYLLTLERVKTRKNTIDLYSEYEKADVKIFDDLMYRHWDKWQNEFSDQLFLYELDDNSQLGTATGVNLQKDTEFDGIMKPFGGLGNITFYKDAVFYSAKKKTGKDYALSTNSEIYIYDIKTGETYNWTEAYQGYDKSPKIHEKTQQFGWLSMATDGFEADKTDIIVRDMKTQEDNNLTAGIDLTVSEFIWSEKGDKIYFRAVIEATYQLFELDVKTKKYRQITTGDYDYTNFHLNKDKFIATRQSMLHPNELFEVDIKTGKAIKLTTINDEFLSKFTAPTIEKRWVTTSDQKQMLTWVIFPPNFDENKKYPALLYCQGGPQSAVSQFFSLRWNFRLMASQGYIVVAPNRRGLPGFGQQWNDAISKDWGGQSIRDYLAAIDDVSQEPYVDKNRRGAIGASYGGYSVYYLAGVHQKRFKTFISHAGLFNMTSWYGTTEELFFANWDLGGSYWEKENEKSYKEFSPHKLVNNWDTPILVFHGGKDFRVPEGQGFEAFQAAQLKGIKSKLVYFPDENHWILSPHNAMVWQHEFYNWLKETLE